MKNQLAKLTVLLSVILIAGAGCIQFKGSETDTQKFGVWMSSDGGFKWETKFSYPKPDRIASIAPTEIDKMIFDPADKDALYIGTKAHGMLFSYNNAESWQRGGEEMLATGRIRAIAVDPSDKCTIFASRTNRLLKSTDCGRTFDKETFVDPRSDATIVDVDIDWFNPNIVYILNIKGEVIKTTDGGKTWRTMYRRAGTARELTIDNSDSRILLVATAKKGVHRSTDGAQSWEEVMKEGYEQYTGIKNIRDIVQTNDATTYWLSADSGLARSNDHGKTWTPVKLITPLGGARVSAIAVDPHDPEHIIYTAGDTFYSSLNGGQNWDTEKLPLASNARSYQLLIDEDNNKTVFMGVVALEAN